MSGVRDFEGHVNSCLKIIRSTVHGEKERMPEGPECASVIGIRDAAGADFGCGEGTMGPKKAIDCA